MIDKITIIISISIVILIAIVIYLFLLHKKDIKNLNDKFTNELYELNSSYTKNLKQLDGNLDKRFLDIDTTLKTIPDATFELNKNITKIMKDERVKIAKYVTESFKQVNSDIIFRSIIDSHSSTSISLNTILKTKKDKYTKIFDSFLNNIDFLNSQNIQLKDDITSYKTDISEQLTVLNDKVSIYVKAQSKAQDFEDRITFLEKKSNSNSSKSDTNYEDSDTLDDTEFEVNDNDMDISDISILTQDKPDDYKNRHMKR